MRPRPRQTRAVVVPSTPPHEFPPLFALERDRLLKMLRSLGPTDWRRPTPCPGWDVLGLCVHLLGGDLSLLSWQRDDHCGTIAPDGLDEPGFIGWLDALQVEWVHAARRLSPRIVVDLLAWTGDQLGSTVAARDTSARIASVSWAGTEPVPVWLDHGRELSERWIHRQQLRQALGHADDLRSDLLVPVLDTFRWAFPYRLDPIRRDAGATVTLTVSGLDDELKWSLVSDGDAWDFGAEDDDHTAAHLRLTTEQAWRLLTNNFDVTVHGEVACIGDPGLIDVLMRTRAIIGTPK